MNRYRLIAKKGEGTFSEVLKAQSIKTSRYVAVKAMKQHFSTVDKVNNLREIQALRRLSPHPNIVSLLEVLYDRPSGRLALVFELMSMNLYELIRGRSHFLDNSLVRIYLFQTLASVAHMHERGIFHRDIKPENILIESSYDVWTGLKLADFGSCRGCYSKHPFTEYISTRWYRAPECLLTDGYYGPEMDVWGIGCVFYEISCLAPLFPGENEKDQLKKIHSVLGTPDEETLSFFRRHASKHVDFNFPPTRGRGLTAAIPNHIPVQMVDLLVKMLRYHPRKRISAKDALMHPYFADLRKQRVPAEMKPYYRFAADGSRLEDDAKPVPRRRDRPEETSTTKPASRPSGGAAGAASGSAAAADSRGGTSTSSRSKGTTSAKRKPGRTTGTSVSSSSSSKRAGNGRRAGGGGRGGGAAAASQAVAARSSAGKPSAGGGKASPASTSTVGSSAASRAAAARAARAAPTSPDAASVEDSPSPQPSGLPTHSTAEAQAKPELSGSKSLYTATTRGHADTVEEAAAGGDEAAAAAAMDAASRSLPPGQRSRLAGGGGVMGHQGVATLGAFRGGAGPGRVGLAGSGRGGLNPPQARAAMEVSRLAVTQNQVWASDTSQFGYRMLEKMGWSEGKGLGKNEQGEETHINVMRKVGKDGIGSKKDATGNNTLTSGFLDFHRILQHLSATHKDGSPQVDLDAAADSEAAAAAVPLDLARIAKAARSAAEREAPSLPPSTEGSGASRVSEEALLRAMAGAAERVGTAPQLKATKRRMRKRLREGDDGEAAGGKRAASADDEAIAAAGARVRQAYRRAIRTKNVKGYSSHDLSAILGDARGAFRAPTTEERQTSNAATRLGEGLDASAVAAAEAVVAVGGGVL
ncbi:hypothetical protein FNF31_00134 [Cafeteria roenbergensis]|uniref:Protein kinase domain-containing protein n=2 Tax=Cafeteria roenbergensis TaxID=33653 RepID=A0A5A8DU81_CAFRO|nr:hypothetical protein FNF31_00134 [Cafeteria roenbergensis]